jgi:hypothetical protein
MSLWSFQGARELERSPYWKAARPDGRRRQWSETTQSFKAQQRAADPREDRHA